MIRTHIYITPRQHEALTKLSAETGLSISDLIRRAIDALTQNPPSATSSAE